MARIQLYSAIAQSVPVDAFADYGHPPWPRGLLPAGAMDLDQMPPGRRAAEPAAPPPGSKSANGQEMLPVGQFADPGWLSKRGKHATGTKQTRLPVPGRADQFQTASHMKPAVVISADLEVARGTALSGGGLSGCTTVRMKNVEPSLMPDMAIAALNAIGFEGQFDFVHVPMDMKRRKNRGILFVNFVEPPTAEAMYQSFHHQTMPGVSMPNKALEITPAYVQGFQENFDRHAEAEAPFLECFRCVL